MRQQKRTIQRYRATTKMPCAEPTRSIVKSQRWNEKNSKAARKTIEENNNFKNSVNKNRSLKRLDPGLFSSNMNVRNSERDLLVTNLKTALILPKDQKVQDIGKFKKTAAYAFQKIEQMLEQQFS